MTWNNGRRLTSLKNGTSVIQYGYDESGLRTKKYTGTYTVYDRDASGNLVHETRNNGTNHLYYYYDANGSIGSISYNGVRYAFRKNLQGDVIAILDTNGNVVAKYTYDAWGKILSVTDGNGNINTSPTFIGTVNPIRYRGYYYDTETGWYYLNSRYYDPSVKRFISPDIAIGVNNDMATHNLYVYCGNNPVSRYDTGGMFWKEIWENTKSLVRDIIHLGNTIAVDLGIDTAAIGAFFLNMEKDDNGIYHANFDCWQWIGGYNDFYDFMFDIGTDMKSANYEFSYNGTSYILWAWKGDYINLGAGAELGIYYGGGPHWFVDKGLAQKMELCLLYNEERIIYWTPDDSQWWITGFNPAYQNIKAENLRAVYTVFFDDKAMYDALRKLYIDNSRCMFGYRYGVGYNVTIIL